MQVFPDKSKCFINRGTSSAFVCDHLGNDVFRAPLSFTDDVIWQCFDIVQIAFSEGVRIGEQHKINQLRSVLCIDEISIDEVM